MPRPVLLGGTHQEGQMLPAEEAAPPEQREAHESMRVHLQNLRLTALHKKARACGIPEDDIETAMDSDQPRRALAELLIPCIDAVTLTEHKQKEQLRARLRDLPLTALRKRASEAGVEEARIETATDASNPRAALVDLLSEDLPVRAEGKHGDSGELGDLGTLTSMLLWGPAREHGMGGTAVAVAVLTTLVWVVQFLCARKLLENAEDSDPDLLKAHLLEGWVQLTVPWMQAGNNVDGATVARCALDGSEANITALSSGDCRQAMAGAFDEYFGIAKTKGETNLPDLPVCFSAEGLANGAVNLTAGMIIVGLTVAKEIFLLLNARHTWPVVRQGDQDYDSSLITNLIKAPGPWLWWTLHMVGTSTINVMLLMASIKRYVLHFPGVYVNTCMSTGTHSCVAAGLSVLPTNSWMW